MRVVGASFDNAANSVRLDGYELVDLRASFAVRDEIEVFGRVENLFDAEHQTAFGYAQPGRGVFAGVRAKL